MRVKPRAWIKPSMVNSKGTAGYTMRPKGALECGGLEAVSKLPRKTTLLPGAGQIGGAGLRFHPDKCFKI
jgi:hypothetical protein